jgi:hypothetical protein
VQLPASQMHSWRIVCISLGLSMGQYLCCASNALLTDRRIYGRADPCGCRWKGCPDRSSSCSRDGHTVERQRGRSSKVQRACQRTHVPCGLLEARKADGNDSDGVAPRCNAAKTPKITLQRNETKRTWPDLARDRRRYPGKMPPCVKVGHTKRANVWQISGRCSADA